MCMCNNRRSYKLSEIKGNIVRYVDVDVCIYVCICVILGCVYVSTCICVCICVILGCVYVNTCVCLILGRVIN